MAVGPQHSPRWMELVGAGTTDADGEAVTLTVAKVHEAYADFVWNTLARFGVAEADRLDQAQEVYIVVHRKLGSYRRDSAITTWLFGIVRRVAAAYRRRAFRVREIPTEAPAKSLRSQDDPADAAERSLARAQLDAILDQMSLDQRAAFVMFEIDGLSGREIAELMDCPVQTAFSRLRRARDIFDREVSKLHTPQEAWS